jgi:phage tail-like protein
MLPSTGNGGNAAPAAVQFAEPYRSYNFRLDINGVTQGHFTECSGPGVKVEALSYREAGNNQIVHRLPGRVQYADVTLKYGLSSSRELFDWLMNAVNGNVTRQNVTVTMLDSTGAADVMHWDLINAWPAEWHGALLDALGHEVAIESITLVYEQIVRG